MKCINCEKDEIITVFETEKLKILTGKESFIAAEIEVPVRKCIDCKTMWTDHETEDIRDKVQTKILKKYGIL